MKEHGFEWDNSRGAQPRPTTPELRIADLDRDGLDAEVVYGCLMINDLIESAEQRAWANAIYNDWVADFARRADPNRVFPLAIIPTPIPKPRRPKCGGARRWGSAAAIWHSNV